MADNYNIRFYKEYEIDASVNLQIAELLDTCFPDTFDGRTYFKQLPHFRYLVWFDEVLIAHVGLDYRVIRVNQAVIPVLGVIDLCVQPDYRHAGVAGSLLDTVKNLARQSETEFVILMGDDDRLYKRKGFQRLQPAITQWLAIEDVHSIDVIERDLSDCFLIQSVRDQRWPEGKIDMLGYLF